MISTEHGLLKEEFTYGGLGRIVTLTRTNPIGIKVYEYTYDLLGQITEIKTDGNVSESYTYDENGNRTSAIGIAASRIRYDEDERMERYDSNLYTYNDAGQLKTKTRSGNTTTYNYSVTGRLKSVDLESGKTIAYQHDALDRRITRKSGNTITQRFLYGSGLGPIAEVDAAGNTISTFIYGTRINVPDYMIRNGKTYYFVLDYLGSVRAVVDVVSGNIEQEIDYDTFGQVLSDSNPGYQPFGFAGGLYDHETKLVRFGARDYDALTGHWTAPDPIGFNGGQFNLYVYVNGDPLNYVDLGRNPVVIKWFVELAAGVPIAIIGSGLTNVASNWSYGNHLTHFKIGSKWGVLQSIPGLPVGTWIGGEIARENLSCGSVSPKNPQQYIEHSAIGGGIGDGAGILGWLFTWGTAQILDTVVGGIASVGTEFVLNGADDFADENRNVIGDDDLYNRIRKNSIKKGRLPRDLR